jgi:hypothetical protein
MPDLLHDLAAPGCSKMGSNWDRCGAHFVEPIEGSSITTLTIWRLVAQRERAPPKRGQVFIATGFAGRMANPPLNTDPVRWLLCRKSDTAAPAPDLLLRAKFVLGGQASNGGCLLNAPL